MMIRDFFRSGLTQRRGLCDKYSSFEDDEYLKLLYSGRAMGGAMELYFLLGIDALPERRMLARAVAAMIISCGAMAVFQRNRSW